MTALAYLFLRAFDAWEFDVVLIETVGVGQTELEVMYIADVVVVTLVPESGDAIQAMKAGLLEIADLFVVNKADRPGSDSFAKELKDSLELGGDAEKVNVLLTTSTEGKGVSAVAEFVLRSENFAAARKHRGEARRLQAEARALLWLSESPKFDKRVAKVCKSTDLAKLF